MVEKVLAVRSKGGQMTLDELASFVQQSMRDGASGREMPTVRVGFGGRIKRIDVHLEVEAPRDGEAQR